MGTRLIFGSVRHRVRATPFPKAWLHTRRAASNLGFIGLGNMGAPMAANLAKFGYRLIVHDNDQQRAKDFSRLVTNADFAKTPREVASVSRIVITMLPDAKQVRSVYLDPDNGIFAEAQERSLFIDSSTIEPAVAKELADILEKQTPGAKYVDAPVSGGVPGARNRKLTFMVGSEKETLSSLENLFLCMGNRVIPCGETGSGQVAKMCNNLILGITMMGVCEAMSLATHLGMEAKPLTDVINVSSGRCWSTDTYHPVPGVMKDVPASRDYDNGFTCDLMLKDLGIALKEADRVNVNAPLSFLAATLYRAMSKKGYGKKDFSGVYKYMYQDKLEIPEAVAKFLAATETEQVVQRTKGKKMKA